MVEDVDCELHRFNLKPSAVLHIVTEEPVCVPAQTQQRGQQPEWLHQHETQRSDEPQEDTAATQSASALGATLEGVWRKARGPEGEWTLWDAVRPRVNKNTQIDENPRGGEPYSRDVNCGGIHAWATVVRKIIYRATQRRLFLPWAMHKPDVNQTHLQNSPQVRLHHQDRCSLIHSASFPEAD